jgi:hypothetical protein
MSAMKAVPLLETKATISQEMERFLFRLVFIGIELAEAFVTHHPPPI